MWRSRRAFARLVLLASRPTRSSVSVKLERKRLKNVYRGGASELTVGAIWIQAANRVDIPFLDDLRGSEAQILADQLAADLGRPLHVIERDDW